MHPFFPASCTCFREVNFKYPHLINLFLARAMAFFFWLYFYRKNRFDQVQMGSRSRLRFNGNNDLFNVIWNLLVARLEFCSEQKRRSSIHRFSCRLVYYLMSQSLFSHLKVPPCPF